MFATLIGTNTVSVQYETVFKRLCEIAIARGFEPPDTKFLIQRDQIPLDGWTLEQKGPPDGNASFFLAVTAPKVPGISPIPVMKTIAGPLFAVMVMDSFFVVSREDQRDVSEFRDVASVVNSFEGFLKSITKQSDSEKHTKPQDTNIHPIDTDDNSKFGKYKLCEVCKRRPGKIEHRISPPMKIVEVYLCDECSRNIVY